jgi:protein phosphatase
MDKIAVISGAYGDSESLKNVINDIRSRGINSIICLGNSIQKRGLNNSECLALVSSNCSVSLMGDQEEGIGLLEEALDYGIDEDDVSNMPFSYQLYISGRLVRLFNENPYNTFNKVTYRQRKGEMFKPSIRTGFDYADVIVCGKDDSLLEELEGFKTLIGVPNVSDGGYMIIEGKVDSKEPESISYQHVRVPKKGNVKSIGTK